MKNVKLCPVKMRCNGLSVNLDKEERLQVYLVDEPDPRQKLLVLKGSKIFHLPHLSYCWRAKCLQEQGSSSVNWRKYF